MSRVPDARLRTRQRITASAKTMVMSAGLSRRLRVRGRTLTSGFSAPLCSLQFGQAIEHMRRNKIVHKLTRGFAKLHPESLCDIVLVHPTLSLQWA
jgi:hypothetical protein